MILGRVTTKWRVKIRLIGDMGIAPYAKVILHPPFGGQTIVIPTHGIKNCFTSHALVTRNGVGVGVREDMTHVQRTAHCGWGSINGVDPFAGRSAVKGIGAFVLPDLSQCRLNAIE